MNNRRGSKRGCAKLTEEQVVEIKRMLNKGMTQHDIALLYGVNRVTIGDIARDRTWCEVPWEKVSRVRGARRGEQHGGAKLTWKQVAEIRQRVAEGESYRQLAREYGVSHVSISCVARGITWKTR